MAETTHVNGSAAPQVSEKPRSTRKMDQRFKVGGYSALRTQLCELERCACAIDALAAAVEDDCSDNRGLGLKFCAEEIIRRIDKLSNQFLLGVMIVEGDGDLVPEQVEGDDDDE